MSRRSARVAQSILVAEGGGPSQASSLEAVGARVQVGGENEDDYKYEDEDEDGVQKKQKSKAKSKPKEKKTLKRKAADTKPEGGQPNLPVKKRARTNRGALKMLLEMPLDIVLEIFSQLTPSDLLNLSRTSKDFRAFLRDRQNAAVWKVSRRNLIPSLPECPDDLSEPRYAHLAFDNFCDFCDKSRHPLYTVWMVRTKVCQGCVRGVFGKTDYYRGLASTASIYNLPCVKVQEFTGNARHSMYHSRWEMLYHTETVRLIEEGLMKGKEERAQFIEDTKKWLAVAFAHANKCEAAMADYERQLAEERDAVIQGRKNKFIAHLRTTKWGEDINSMSEAASAALRNFSSELTKACEKELTQRVIAKLAVDFEDHMYEEQRKHLERARRHIMGEKIPVVIGFLKNYKSENLTPTEARQFPNIADLLRHPTIVQAIADSAPGVNELSQFDGLIPLLPGIATEIRERIKEDLANLVAPVYRGYKIPQDTMLTLATTLFSCSLCWKSNHPETAFQSEAVRYPRAMIHACANMYRADCEKEEEIKFVGEKTHRTKWNRHKVISLKKANMALLRSVVGLCGFDPDTTTADEMDEADPIVECVSCHDRYSGRATMRWSVVPAHHRQSHGPNCKGGPDREMELKLLDEEDAQKARIRMDEAEDIVRATPYKLACMVCAHCWSQEENCTSHIEDHVRHKHCIPHPTKADVLRSPDEPNVQNVFRLWPPLPVLNEKATRSHGRKLL